MKAAMIEELKKNAEEQADDSVKASMSTVHDPVEKKPIFPRSDGGLLSALPNLEEVQGHLQGVAKDMAALGPEGEGPSQIFAGMASMASAFERYGKRKPPTIASNFLFNFFISLQSINSN